jgi:hypothetical protein
MPATPVYRRLELNFHTQYAEVKERARTEPELLPGTPGCPRRSNFDPPCRLNFDPGLLAENA